VTIPDSAPGFSTGHHNPSPESAPTPIPSPPSQQCVGGFFIPEVLMSLEAEALWLRILVQLEQNRIAILKSAS
jgi:hypothetical protein